MSKVRPLYKSTIVVWSETDPSKVEASDLVRDGEVNDNYIARQDNVLVEDPTKDPDWDDGPQEFFFDGIGSEDEDGEEEG
jgi:hypothetical protein